MSVNHRGPTCRRLWQAARGGRQRNSTRVVMDFHVLMSRTAARFFRANRTIGTATVPSWIWPGGFSPRHIDIYFQHVGWHAAENGLHQCCERASVDATAAFGTCARAAAGDRWAVSVDNHINRAGGAEALAAGHACMLAHRCARSPPRQAGGVRSSGPSRALPGRENWSPDRPS